MKTLRRLLAILILGGLVIGLWFAVKGQPQLMLRGSASGTSAARTDPPVPVVAMVLKMGTVALDGTKIHANASRHSALSSALGRIHPSPSPSPTGC